MSVRHPEVSLADNVRRWLIWATIGSLCLIAAAAIVALLTAHEVDDTEAKILGTAGAVMVYSLTALGANSLRQRRPDLSWFGAAGLTISAVALGLSVMAMWVGDDSDGTWGGDWSWMAALTGLYFAVASGHAAVLIGGRRATDGALTGAARGLAVITVFLLALLLTIETFSDFHEGIPPRLLAIVAVLWVLGTVLIPFLRLAERSDRPS